MYWIIYIKMYSHDRQNWWWAECCRVESNEMLGIAERAIACHQTTKVKKHEYRTAWGDRAAEPLTETVGPNIQAKL